MSLMTPLEQRNSQLRRILKRAKTLAFYQERLKDIDPEKVSISDLSALPFISRDDLVKAFESSPPDAGFMQKDIVQMHLTPAPSIGRMPEYLTAWDLERQGEATAAHFARCGISAQDRCLIVFERYHMLARWLAFA
ncbi:MAG: hypothetical protein R2880_01370 [Deinococcales bacterium]